MYTTIDISVLQQYYRIKLYEKDFLSPLSSF